MKPVIRFSMPSSMRPICTQPQYEALMQMRAKGWQYFDLDPTIFRNLEQKGFIRREGKRAYITEEGRSILP